MKVGDVVKFEGGFWRVVRLSTELESAIIQSTDQVDVQGDPIQTIAFISELIPVAFSVIAFIKDLFIRTLEERKAAEERKQARREWREFKREERHRRKLEKITARNDG